MGKEILKFTCPRCGLTEGEIFCGNCGMKRTPEDPEKYLCLRCNKKTEGETYCSICGKLRGVQG